MTQLFEPGFLERQAAVYPELDVHVYAGAVREWAQHHPVRNPNGLLVHWLERAEKARRARVRVRNAEEALDLDRYADFWVQLLRLVALRGLGPGEIGRCLDAARQGGFPKLNRRITERLAKLPGSWPPEAPCTRRDGQMAHQGGR